MKYIAIDVMHVALQFVAVAVTPELPLLAPGSSHMVRVTRPDGSAIETLAVVEYRQRPPIVPVLLRFGGILPTDIPLESRLEFVDQAFQPT